MHPHGGPFLPALPSKGDRGGGHTGLLRKQPSRGRQDAHADGTEFTAPITVNHMAYSEVTDIHVVLSGLRLCGAGDMTGTGVTAKAPTYLNSCWITNWNVGALAADGGWIWVPPTKEKQDKGPGS